MTKLGLSKKQFGWRLLVVAVLVVALAGGVLVPQIDTASAVGANPIRDLPDPDPTTVASGVAVTLDVIVTFTAPSDALNSIGIVDTVPAGWTIEVNAAWCTPEADATSITGDDAEYAWFGPYSSGQTFTAMYKVTVPADAECDTYLFDGRLGYKIASSAFVFEPIGGDSIVIVDAPHLCTDPDPLTAVYGMKVVGTILTWSFDITNCGIGELAWTITADPEISLSAVSGTTTTETDTIGVEIDTSTMLVCPQEPYIGTITINSNGGCNGGESKEGHIYVTPTMEVIRDLPDFALVDGDPFEVRVTFTAPHDDFNAIGLVDNVPSGWPIQVDPAWCTPTADQVIVVGNQPQFAWYGPYPAGTPFTAIYRVSVPAGTECDTYHEFTDGLLCYHIGTVGQCCVDVNYPKPGDDWVQAICCQPVRGLTRDVNCNILPDVEIWLDGVGPVFSDGAGNYEITASEPGAYMVTASKEGFRERTIIVEVDCASTVTLNFENVYGLIPCSPDIWYALDCVNKWLYPEPPCGLDIWTALDVVNAWLYPGCT